ncbi:MAG: lipoate--protein ligase, partial [Bacteroidales bacterium]|nr:lipoate--protein ligase [Bacteroidales bacterium]
MSYSVLYQDIGTRDYKEAWELQENVFRKIISRKIALQEKTPVDEPEQPGTLILVEHPHVYTLGKSGSEDNL